MTRRPGRFEWGLASRYVVLAFFPFIFVFPLAYMLAGSLDGR